MRRPIWCPSWCFLFLAFTRNGVSLTSAWGWKRSIGASQRSNLLITSESDTSLSLTKSDHLPRGGAVLNETSLNDAGKVAVEDPAEVSKIHEASEVVATIFLTKVFFRSEEPRSFTSLVSIGRYRRWPSCLSRVTGKTVSNSLSG